MPRVTVLMPTYNVAPWVDEAIRSVLNQTYKDFELLVIDDASTDDTISRVRAFNDPRIRVAAFPNNVGLADNLNRGLDITDTELVARMDGDDIAEPDWLETGIKVLDDHPEVGVCSFGFQFFGTKTSLVRFPEWNEDSKVQMLFGCTVIVPVLRRSVFVDHDFRYSTAAFPAEDYMMWSDVYRVTQVYNVQRTLFHYRTHETQISTAKRQAQIEKSNQVRLRMLDWLNDGFSEDEKSYFLNVFVPCVVKGKTSVEELKHFADLLVSRNTQGHYDDKALRKKFQSHISYGSLDYVEKAYFEKKYSVRGYFGLLRSGLYAVLPPKNRKKILLKCLMGKRK